MDNDVISRMIPYVPTDVAELLRRVALTSYAVALCSHDEDGLRIRSVADLKYLTVADLTTVGMLAWEARKLLAALPADA